MFNLYLYSQSFTGATIQDIENGLSELNKIVVNSNEPSEKFWKNSDSLFAVNISGEECFGQVIWTNLNPQFRATILPRLLSQIGETERDYDTIADFERDYPAFGAFYGISFANNHPQHVCDKNAYDRFRDDCFNRRLRPEQFRELASAFLPNLTFGEKAFEGILSITDPKLFVDVINALWLLDSSNADGWSQGYYDHRSRPVTISGESEKTMKDPQLERLRHFAFSDGRERCCKLHVKINRAAHRIHIYPEKGRIYVGYIGPHLPTSKS
jgi:hypothetical protein